MPLSGGAAAKFGERYEGRWTVVQLADIMAERADAIRLEPPGVEGEGVEFWVRRGNRYSYHQVKRQAPRARGWNIDELGRAGVLSHFFKKLEDPFAFCVFVSSDAAGDLRELSERARDAAGLDEFKRDFLKGQSAAAFAGLSTYVRGVEQSEMFERLKRIEARNIDEVTLQRFVESQLLPLVEGEPFTVAALLAQFALDNVHQEIATGTLWRAVERHGLRPRQWAKDALVLQGRQPGELPLS